MVFSAALSKNTVVAAAIARPARTRCQRGHRERKRSCVARVSTVGAQGSTRADFRKNKYDENTKIRAPIPSTAVKYILGYSTRNDKFKHLEPHFKLSATRSASKEGTENAVALPHSRECTEEPISALPNDGSKEKFGGRAELWSVLQGKLRGRGGSSCRFDRKIGKKMFWGGAMQHGVYCTWYDTTTVHLSCLLPLLHTYAV